MIGAYSTCTNPAEWKFFIGNLDYGVVDSSPAKTIPIDYFFWKALRLENT